MNVIQNASLFSKEVFGECSIRISEKFHADLSIFYLYI